MGEETSLARQLKKLAVPQTSILTYDKYKPSLLYSREEAASISRDKFFEHGCTGLDKLMVHEAKFAPFQQSLFSESSKNFERSVQTKDVNKKLNETIADFLRILSPYVCLHEAIEALDWLIQRFHIHLFNIDDLIACILPYHETNIFVRILSLLDLKKSTGRWYWLKPFKDSRSAVGMSVIIKRFNSDGSFRKFVCDLIPNIMKVYGRDKESASLHVISFSTLVVYNALQESETITDNTVALLLPYVTEGLKSEVPSYCSGTYMIICSILMREKLASSILKQLLIRIAQCCIPSLLKESLETIVLMFQQQDIKSIPKKAFCSLRSSKDIIPHLKYVSETYLSTNFLHCLIKRAVPSAYRQELLRKSSKPGNALTFLLNTLNSVSLQKSDVTFCMRLILNWFTKLNKKHRGNATKIARLKRVGKSLLKCLEFRCAEHFDTAVELYFKKKPSNKSARRLLNSSVTSLQHELLPDSSVTLFIGMNHALVSVRTQTVNVLIKKLSSEQVLDSEFVKDLLIARLNDDCPEVILPILMSGTVLFKYLSKQQSFNSLKSVLQKTSKQELETWHSVKLEALKLICNLWEFCLDDVPLQGDIFSVMIPYLLPLQGESMEYLSCILDSTLSTKHPVISAIKEASLKYVTTSKDQNEKLADMSCMIIQSLLSAIGVLDDATKYETVSLLVQKQSELRKDCRYSFLVVLILQHIVVMSNNICQQRKWVCHALELFSDCLDSNKVVFTNEGLASDVEVIRMSLKILKKKKIPICALFFALQEMIKSLKIKCFSEKFTWWPDLAVESEASSSYAVLLDLFQFLTKYMNTTGQDNHVFKLMFGTMIQIHFEDLKKIFWFLASLWSDYANPTVALKITAIKVAEALCISTAPSLSWLFEKSCVVIPSLLVAISAQSQQIRIMALELLEKILSCESSGFPSTRSFVINLCQHSKEIIMDSNQLFHIAGHWLSPAVEKFYSHKLQSSNEFIVLEWLQHLILDDNTPKVIKLNMLSLLQWINSKEILSSLFPVLKKYLKLYKDKETDMTDTAIIQQLLNKFTVETAALLENETGDAFVVLSSALKLIIHRENCVNTVVQEMALKQITKEFFIAIPSASVQQKILGMLVDLYLSSVPSDLTSKINRTLRKLCVYAPQLLKVLRTFEFASPMKTVKEMRRSRVQLISSTSDLDFLESGPWKKIVVILEIIQDKKKLNQKEILIPELFNILSKTLEWENQPSVEYVRQLVLSSIFNCCDQLGISDLDETKFQVELVVQCIRISDNPKTHRQSLLLLNLAATIFPEYVLNNIMSIFTFMGSSIICRDDSYSFQVISQTIETIVPALLQASHQQKESDSLQVIATVLRVFVDSLLHIPHQCQLPLFTKLITTLGPSDYLWLPLAQICGNYVVKEDNIAAMKKDPMVNEDSELVKFSFNLFHQYTPNTQVNACTELIRFLMTLPDKKRENHKRQKTGKEDVTHKEPFDVAIHSELQLQHYKFTVLYMVNALLSSQTFIEQVSQLEAKSQRKMEEQYKSLFEIVLQYLKHMTQTDCLVENGDLWKATTAVLYDLLNSVNALLPCDQFISFVLKLLKSQTALVRCKTLEMLNAKLEHQPTFFAADKYALLLKMLRPLLKIVRNSSSTESSIATNKDSTDVQNQQNALLSVHLICRITGSKYPVKFEKVLHAIVRVLSSDSSEYPLVVNALLCLAQLCKCLKAHVLPQLNMFMPKIISLLEELHAIERNDYLALGVVTALQGLIEYLGAFMGCFMEPIIAHVCELASKLMDGKGKKADLEIKLQKLLELIAAEVPVRVLVPAVSNSYEKMMQKNKSAIISLMFILRERTAKMDLGDLRAHWSQMETFYILALDFRSKNSQEPLSLIESVEESIIASFVRLCLKCSEPSFRQYFNSIKYWIRSSPEESKDRVLTFYRLMHKLSSTLKHLFVHCAGIGTFSWHVASILDANNTSKAEKPYFGKSHTSTTKSTQLLNYILDSFTNCFLYDNEKLVDKDVFNTLMQPLVDQIENEQGGDEVYKERIEEHLAPCVGHFAVSVTDSALWKQLNYQILLKTRHSSPKVRFAALQVLREMVKKMDTEYLTLLPESVPFLAELMEDDSSEVEQQCQTVVAEMEQILGEPLSKYF